MKRKTKITLGIGLGIFGLCMLVLNWGAVFAIAMPFVNKFALSAAIGMVALLGLTITFNKDGLTADNVKLFDELEKRIGKLPDSLTEEQRKTETRALITDFLKDVDLNKMKEMLGDDEKGLRSILIKQGEMINELKKGQPKEVEDMSIRAQVAAWQTRNKDVIAKIKAGDAAPLPKLEIRAAASPMTPANTISDTITIAAGSVIRMGGEVFDLHRVLPTLWDYINKGRTGLETYPWVNKKVPAASGAAAFIGPGIAKPGVSFTFEVEKSNAKKVAVSLKLATELLDDIDGMTTYVQVELAYQLKNETNSKLMTGVESATVPAGVQTFSLPFTTSGLSTVNPNNWDCCRSLVAQIRKAFINSPIVIFMNPIDTANMDMEKAVSQGTYMGLNVRQVPGAIIVEDYNVGVGFIQAIAVDCWKNLIYKDFSMAFGWENDDFTKNQVTVVAEMRLHSFHSENDIAGFVYDDLADIKSQIAAA